MAKITLIYLLSMHLIGRGRKYKTALCDIQPVTTGLKQTIPHPIHFLDHLWRYLGRPAPFPIGFPWPFIGGVKAYFGAGCRSICDI